MDNKKLSCCVPQCSCWDETCGCMKKENADNGQEPCDEFNEIDGCKVFIIIEGGMVSGVYAERPEICVEILDLDGNGDDPDTNDALKKRAAEIAEKYHEIY